MALNCFKPKGVPSKKEIILGLEKSRGDLEGNNSSLKKKVGSLEEQLAISTSRYNVLQGKLTSTEADARSKEAAIMDALERTLALHRAIQAVMGDRGAQGKPSQIKDSGPAVAVDVQCQESGSDKEDDKENNKGNTSPEPDGRPLTDLRLGPPKATLALSMSLEQNLEESLLKHELAQAELLEAFRSGSKEQANSKAQVVSLEALLKISKAKTEQVEEKAKGQLAALESALTALDTQNGALSDMNNELQKQVEQLTQDFTTTRALHTADVEAAAALRSDFENTRTCFSTSQGELDKVSANLAKAQSEVAARESLILELQSLNLALTKKQEELEGQTVEQGKDLGLIRHSLCEAEGSVSELTKQAEASQLEVERLESQIDELQDKLSTAEAASLASVAAAATTQQELHVTRAMLLDAEQQVESTQEMLVASQQEAQVTKEHLAATKAELQERKSALSEVQGQLSSSIRDLSASTLALSSAQERVMDTGAKLQESNTALEASKLALTEMTAQYMSTKKDLINTTKQMADIARNHNKALDKMGSSDDQIHNAQIQLQEVQTTLAMTSAELSASKVKLVDFEKGWAVVEADNAKLRELGEVLQGEVDAKRAVLAAIARLPRTQKSKATDKEQVENASVLDGYYHAAASEDVLRLKVCDAPLPLCGPLLAAIVDSKRLTHLALDMDSGREAVWEKTGLRIACLAAALALNDSIQSLELTGWTWDESGSGSALAFLPLGSQRRMGSLNAGIRHEGLSSVKIDTRLFDAESALALSDLLQSGGVDLKRPGGKGVLRLFSDNENLDEWYGLMIKDAVHKPTDISSAPLYRTSAPPRLPGAGTSPSTPPHSTSSLASATKSATVDVVATQASVTPVDSDLSDEGLESHHMVIIMVVLMQCPHLRRLRIDGNKIGNCGAEIISTGLAHNASLLELGLARNCVQVTGAKHMAAALQKNSSLLKLDISGQRFEGLGAAGVEAIASIISHRSSVSALEELNLSSCNMGPSGGAALAGALRSAGGRGPRGPIALRRLLVSQNGLDVAATKELRAAASERTVAISM